MTNEELCQRLNAEFDLVGDKAVTPVLIRKWVGWGVLPKASAHGRSVGQSPSWSRDDEAMRRARRLAELRSLNVKGQREVIAQAYFEWGHPKFEKVREAIATELHRAGAQLRKQLYSSTVFPDFQKLSPVQVRSFRRQGGPLDQRFIGTEFEQSSELYVSMLDWVRTGLGDRRKILSVIAEAVRGMAPDLDDNVKAQLIGCIVSGTAGLFGADDETNISGAAAVRAASEQQFISARKALRRYLAFINHAAHVASLSPDSMAGKAAKILAPIADQITVSQWSVSVFAAILKGQKDKQSNG